MLPPKKPALKVEQSKTFSRDCNFSFFKTHKLLSTNIIATEEENPQIKVAQPKPTNEAKRVGFLPNRSAL
jgi:hypothetical protein